MKKACEPGKKGMDINIMLVIITFLIVFLLFFSVFEGLFVAARIPDNKCSTFCEMRQDEPKGYGWRHWRFTPVVGQLYWAASKIGIGEGGQSASTVFFDRARQTIDRPSDCYCGVDIESGKYLHVHGFTDEPGEPVENLEEFHLTDQNPGIHLGYETIDFDHTGGLRSCQLIVQNNIDFIHSLPHLEEYPGCIIVDIRRVDGGMLLPTYHICGIKIVEEGFKLENDGTIESQVEGSEYFVGGSLDFPDEHIYGSLSLGDDVGVTVGPRHPAQRDLLVERGEEGDEIAFELENPIICTSDTDDDKDEDEIKPRTKLDRACLEQCEDAGGLTGFSACLEVPEEGYEPLVDEYKEKYENEDEFCPDEGEGPYCACVGETKHVWKVVDG